MHESREEIPIFNEKKKKNVKPTSQQTPIIKSIQILHMTSLCLCLWLFFKNKDLTQEVFKQGQLINSLEKEIKQSHARNKVLESNFIELKNEIKNIKNLQVTSTNKIKPLKSLDDTRKKNPFNNRFQNKVVHGKIKVNPLENWE